MTSIDTIVQDIEAQSTFESKVQTLLSGLKHRFAAALAGANLPPTNRDQVAAIFPELEGNASRIVDALKAEKPPEMVSAAPKQAGKASAPSTDAAVSS